MARRRYSIDEISEEDWDFQVDINLKAVFFLCRAAGRAMVAAGQGGRIITFSSQAWWTGGLGGSVAYAATKGGITTACRGLARTFGPHRITVNCVVPGRIDTVRVDPEIPGRAVHRPAVPPIGRLGLPEEVAAIVRMLCGPDARYITGQAIHVNGGGYMP